jgi:hypothetical protein
MWVFYRHGIWFTIGHPHDLLTSHYRICAGDRGVTKPSVVHLLNTRLLEPKEVLRTPVRKGNVVEALPAVLVLETVAIGPRPLSRSSLGMPRPRAENTELPGQLRIDLLTDTLFRVRYAEGSKAPENRTPMVVGNFEGPTESRVTPGVVG